MKKRKRGVGEEKSTRTRKATIEEEIDVDMPNVVEPITIEKHDQSTLYRSIRRMCGKDNQDVEEEVKMEKSVEDMVPTWYLSVFKKKKSERLPLRKPWDHTIETKSGFQLKKSKVYTLSPKVQEVDALLDSGATGLFIDRACLRQKKITTRQLEHPIEVYNIDGSIN